MTKSDLKTGMVIEFSSKCRFKKAVIYKTMYKNILIYDTGNDHDTFDSINEDLSWYEDDRDDPKDIIAIYKVPKNVATSYLFRPTMFKELIEKSTECIWRKNPKYKEVTIEELEAKYGCKIRIVKEKQCQ